MTVVAMIKASHFEIDGHGLDHLQIHPKLISQSVQLKEVPTKIIKITKTIAIRVPVPYPVKVVLLQNISKIYTETYSNRNILQIFVIDNYIIK